MADAVVVGCEAIDAGPDWVRLRVPGAAVRSIPWASITAAAAPTDDEHMKFEGNLAPITEFRATHVPLWIEYGDGVAVAMLERDDPRREAIVAAFRERLGSRWIDQLTTAQAAMRMFKPIPSAAGMQRRILWMILAVIALIVLPMVAMIAVHVLHSR
jgi:hypothetical protein